MLNKILPIFFSPSVVILAMLAAGLAFRSFRLCAAAGVLFLVLSLPIVADWIFATAQGNVVRPDPRRLPRADAVVVLGGSIEYVAGAGGNRVPEWNDAVDRLFGGLEAMEAQLAPKIVFSAGAEAGVAGVPSEGDIMASQARKFGLRAQRIFVAPPASNTEAEARVIRRLLEPADQRIVLVTSALHLPRAQMIFEATGFSVIPYPVDLRVAGDPGALAAWTPTPSAMGKVGMVVRELLGRLYYRVLIALGGVAVPVAGPQLVGAPE